MTFTMWLTGMAVMLMVAMIPLAGDGRSGYPLWLNALVGVGAVIGGSSFPSDGCPWLVGLLTVAAVAVAPMVVDAAMDRAPAPQDGDPVTGDGYDAMDAGMITSGLAASTASMTTW